jgi:hypothetical protein
METVALLYNEPEEAGSGNAKMAAIKLRVLITPLEQYTATKVRV